MSFKIGFAAGEAEKANTAIEATESNSITPRKSVVDIYFEGRELTCTYYNDSFDLHEGDYVFVDGKLENMLGKVVKVGYNFKIRPSAYQRVVAVADTKLKGQFFTAKSYILTFDPSALPKEKVSTWFIPPQGDDEYICSSDDESFPLEEMDKINVSRAVFDRGVEYYIETQVAYLSVSANGTGYAIVEGKKPYEVEFEYKNGEISRLVCQCYCAGYCKHEIAALFQLRETLKYIDENYADEFEKNGCFAVVDKYTMSKFVFGNKLQNGFTL